MRAFLLENALSFLFSKFTSRSKIRGAFLSEVREKPFSVVRKV
jgi:hypothetical protein